LVNASLSATNANVAAANVAIASIVPGPNLLAVSSNIVPTTANVYTLGTVNRPWNYSYVGNIAFTDGTLQNTAWTGNVNNTGNFIFSGNDAALPPGNAMTLSTYQSGGNKESRLTLSTSGISSLDVGNNLRITTGYGTGFEQYWTFGAGGSITFPDASSLTTGNIMASLFSMANATHWTESVTTIGAALNQLAARIYAIENP
jgi:hypothetical protein